MTNSGCSASKGWAVCSGLAASTLSCHHTSRPGVQATSWPVRRTTSTCSRSGRSRAASSAADFTSTAFPRRNWPSLVTSSFARVSWRRKRTASALKPPKTRECTAPMRAQASAMTTVSTSTGR
jgi:hypothetical protein